MIPAMMFGLEIVALKKRQEAHLEVDSRFKTTLFIPEGNDLVTSWRHR